MLLGLAECQLYVHLKILLFKAIFPSVLFKGLVFCFVLVFPTAELSKLHLSMGWKAGEWLFCIFPEEAAQCRVVCNR